MCLGRASLLAKFYKERMVEIYMKKRAQVAIFVIVGLMIVSAILIYFLLVNPSTSLTGSATLDFDACVQEVVDDAIDELGANAGYVDPELTYRYNGDEFTYLCYTNEYYEAGTIQKAFLKQFFEDSLELKTKEGIESCYDNSIKDLKDQGYEVAEGDVDYNISLEPSMVSVQIKAPTSVEGKGYTNFLVVSAVPIYDILMIATSIVQYETRFGDSDTDSLRLLYPDFSFRKVKRSDGTKVYFIESYDVGTVFKFASRSYAYPSGYFS